MGHGFSKEHFTMKFWIIFINHLDCLRDLGLESGEISDGQISASSEWDSYVSVLLGRLRSPRSWSAGVNEVNQWYQVDLGSEYTKVTGIATQGRGDHPQWVTKYKLWYSENRVKSYYYQEQGSVKVSHNSNRRLSVPKADKCYSKLHKMHVDTGQF